MKLRINVTARDIQQARLCQKMIWSASKLCPVARATRRHRRDATVGHVNVSISDALAYELPPRAKDFIKKFDAREEVQPFCFTLDLSNPI